MNQYVVTQWWPRVRKQRWPDSWRHESASQMLHTTVSQGPFGQRWHRYMALSGKVDNNLNANNPLRQFFWVIIQYTHRNTSRSFVVRLAAGSEFCYFDVFPYACCVYNIESIFTVKFPTFSNCFANQSNSRVSPHDARKRPRAFSLGAHFNFNLF